MRLLRSEREGTACVLVLDAEGAEVIVEVAPATASRRAFRVVGAHAIAYRGSSAQAARAAAEVADRLARAGSLDALLGGLPSLAAPPPAPSAAPICLGGRPVAAARDPSGPCVACRDASTCAQPTQPTSLLRPRTSDEPLVDVLAIWSRLAIGTARSAAAAAELRRDGTARAVFELGLTLGDGDALGPPRLTRYQEDADPRPGLRTFARMSGREVALAEGLGAHAGFADAADGVSHELYVTTDGLDAETARARLALTLAQNGHAVALPATRRWCWLSFADAPSGVVPTRAYEEVSGRTLGWDVRGGRLVDEPTVQHEHFLDAHPSIDELVVRLDAGPVRARRIAAALAGTRWYARFLARPIDARGVGDRVAFLHVGPWAPPTLALP